MSIVTTSISIPPKEGIALLHHAPDSAYLPLYSSQPLQILFMRRRVFLLLFHHIPC